MVYFQTEDIILRDHTMDDFDNHHRLLSDPLTLYYWPDIGSSDTKDNRVNLKMAVDEAQNINRDKFFFAMICRHSGDYLGSIGYTIEAVTPVGSIAEVGYAILPQFRGKGYTTKALAAVIKYAFTQGGVYRLRTGCLAENAASERVMQKNGMTKEAHFKHHSWHEGEMKDRVEYRILRSEFLLHFPQ